MTFYDWSKTATNNANADPTINWAEGMSPSSVNDSARAMMAAAAKYRDDNGGGITTTGTATSYVVTTNQQFDTLAHLDGQSVCFTPHVTNTGSQAFVTIDGLGPFTLRLASGVDVGIGTLQAGTPYEGVYRNSDGNFYLKNFFSSGLIIPLGATLDWWAGTVPSAAFMFPVGQAISRTTYAGLFALFGSFWGAGDGSTTFQLPDLRGRAAVAADTMGGSGDAGRLINGSISARTLGGSGGEAVHGLSVAEIPSITSIQNGIGVTVAPGSGAGIPITSSPGNISQIGTNGGTVAVPSSTAAAWSGIGSLSGSINVSVQSQNTAGSVHNNIQPTIVCNRIMRVL